MICPFCKYSVRMIPKIQIGKPFQQTLNMRSGGQPRSFLSFLAHWSRNHSGALMTHPWACIEQESFFVCLIPFQKTHKSKLDSFFDQKLTFGTLIVFISSYLVSMWCTTWYDKPVSSAMSLMRTRQSYSTISYIFWIMVGPLACWFS